MNIMSTLNHVNLPSNEAQVIPSDFSGIVAKAANQTWLNFNSASSDSALTEADLWQQNAFEEATGERLPASVTTHTPEEYREAGNVNAFTHRFLTNKKLDALRASNPALYKTVPTLGMVEEKAKDMANKSTEDLAEAQFFTRSDWTGTAAFIGGLGGAMADPVNLATMPLGGGGRTVIGLMMREAALGATVEAGLQPMIAKWQSELGQEYGLDDATMNVLMGAAGAAGLSGMFRAAHRTYQGATGAWAKLAEEYRSDSVMYAGLKAIESDAHLKGNDPSTTIYGSRTHLEAVDFGQRALERGTLPDPKLVARGNEAEFSIMQDISHVDWTIAARERGIDFDNPAELEAYIRTVLQVQEGMKVVKRPVKEKLKKEVQETDEILEAIAKLGGIDRVDAGQQGIDPADFRQQRAGVKYVFKKSGGKSFDAMAESLSELGYFKGDYTANELVQLVSDSLSGRKKYTPTGEAKAAERAYQDELIQRSEEISEDNAYHTYDEIDSARIIDDISESLKELDKQIGETPLPTKQQYTDFNRVLSEAEIFPEIRSKEQIGEQLDRMEQPDIEEAMVAEFDRAVESSPSEVVYLDDGTAVKYADLQARFKEDDKVLEAMESCAI